MTVEIKTVVSRGNKLIVGDIIYVGCEPVIITEIKSAVRLSKTHTSYTAVGKEL